MIVLPFPSARLSGHNDGSWYMKRAEIKKHREWARAATLAVKPAVPTMGDIPIHFRFVPPDRRSDRMNFTNRLKPYADGIADALGVNDVRFLPSFEFCTPEKPGRVEVTFPPLSTPCETAVSASSVLENGRPGTAAQTASGPNQNTCDGGAHGSGGQ